MVGPVLLLFYMTILQGQDGAELHRQELKAIQRLYGKDILISRVPAERRVYKISSDPGILAYLVSTRARGRYDYFDYYAVFSPDLEVVEVRVTVYRSSHGAGICQKKWLDQFTGYQGGTLEMGQDIDALSGATISAGSITKDIQDCHSLLKEINSRNN